MTAAASSKRCKAPGATMALAVAVVLSFCGCAASFEREASRSEHVILHSTLNAEEATLFVARAQTFVEEFSDFLGVQLPQQPIQLFLFDTRVGLWRFLRERCPDQSTSAAACFEEGEYCVVALHRHWTQEQTIRHLRHELAHAVVASHFYDVPPWIHEGLAQYFESCEVSQAYKELLRRLRRNLKRKDAPLLDTLVARPWGAPLTRYEYAQAWGLVHFILNETPYGAILIRSYLRSVHSGADPAAQFEQVFGRTPCKIEPEWRKYILSLEPVE